MSTPWEEGTPDRPLIVLAESPSFNEIRLGRPLVGPSGTVFEDCLRSSGLHRQQCYILNVWPFQVKKSDGGDIYALDGSHLWHRNTGITQDGIDAAGETLGRIQASSASTILTFGQQACAVATGKSRSITKWRGSILAGTPDVAGKKVVPTLHPAATLHRTYLWRYNIIADMRRASEEMRTPDLQLPRRTFLLRPTLQEVLLFIAECRAAGTVATDLEVINNQVSCFSVCHTPDRIMCVPLQDDAGHYWTAEQEVTIWRVYAALMEDAAVRKVNQNIVGFDMPFLVSQNHIHTQGELCDTMIAQHILYPEFPKGLDFITSVHTREPYYKDDGKLWKNPAAAGAADYETFWRYCCRDAAVALEAWEKLAVELTEGGYQQTYDMTVRLANPLSYMTALGLRIDQEALDETRERVSADLRALEAELAKLAPGLNPNSPKQCRDYFYRVKGCEPYVNEKGQETVDDKALSRIYRRDCLPEAKLIQIIRATAKLKSTYLEVALDRDGRLRCSWNPRGTWTGRLSSSQTLFGTGMNLQNLAPDFKGFIVAD